MRKLVSAVAPNVWNPRILDDEYLPTCDEIGDFRKRRHVRRTKRGLVACFNNDLDTKPGPSSRASTFNNTPKGNIFFMKRTRTQRQFVETRFAKVGDSTFRSATCDGPVSV